MKQTNDTKKQLDKDKEKIMLIIETIRKIDEFKIYKEIISDSIHVRQQKEVIRKEIQNSKDYQIKEYDHLPLDTKAVRSKWIFKVKYTSNRIIARNKARLVIQSFLQVYRINFNENFSLLVR